MVLNERSQSEKAAEFMTPAIRHAGRGKTTETVISGCQEVGGVKRWTTGIFKAVRHCRGGYVAGNIDPNPYDV